MIRLKESRHEGSSRSCGGSRKRDRHLSGLATGVCGSAKALWLLTARQFVHPVGATTLGALWFGVRRVPLQCRPLDTIHALICRLGAVSHDLSCCVATLVGPPNVFSTAAMLRNCDAHCAGWTFEASCPFQGLGHETIGWTDGKQKGHMSESRPLSAPTEWWQPYVADPGPEKPSRLSQVLAETIPVEPCTKKLLDIGCASGIIGLYCLLEKKARSVTFIDLMPEWIDITRANIRLKIEKCAITPSQVDVMDAMPFARISPEVVAQHDMLIFNLPQYPGDYANPSDLSKFEADPIKAHYRLAGPDGLKLARDFSQWYSRLKQPKPDAVFVLWSILGKRQIIEALAADGFQWKIIQETPVPVKPEFSRVAARFFEDPEEKDNRMLERNGDGWTNKVLTIRLTSI